MMKAIYTAILGDYDKFIEPEFINSDYDYHLFTDQPIKSKVYQVHKLKCNNPIRKSREIKILSHKYLKNYEYTIWHDGRITQMKDVSGLDRDWETFDFIG